MRRHSNSDSRLVRGYDRGHYIPISREEQSQWTWPKVMHQDFVGGWYLIGFGEEAVKHGFGGYMDDERVVWWSTFG